MKGFINKVKWMAAGLILLILPGLSASAESPSHVPWVSHLSGESGSLLVKQPDTDWFEAVVNTPLGEEDMVFQEEGGRSEIFIEKGTFLRLGRGAAVEFIKLSSEEVRVLLTQGEVIAGNRKLPGLMIDIPGQTVFLPPGSKARIKVSEFGETEVSARRGRVRVEGPRGSFRVLPGQTLKADETGEVVRLYRGLKKDDFESWSDSREAALARAAVSAPVVSYLAEPAVFELSLHGVWINDPEYGWVWRPRVAAGWAPYRVGRWVFRPGWGWTWVSYEPWGWYPYHYGRWVLLSSGWCWVPVQVTAAWAPALVLWLEGPDYIAWQPLPFRLSISMVWSWPEERIIRHVDYRYITCVRYVDLPRGHYQRHVVRFRPVSYKHTLHVVRAPVNYSRHVEARKLRTPSPRGFVAEARRPRPEKLYPRHGRPRTGHGKTNVPPRLARAEYGAPHMRARGGMDHLSRPDARYITPGREKASHPKPRPGKNDHRNIHARKTPRINSRNNLHDHGNARGNKPGPRSPVMGGRGDRTPQKERNRAVIKGEQNRKERPKSSLPKPPAPGLNPGRSWKNEKVRPLPWSLGSAPGKTHGPESALKHRLSPGPSPNVLGPISSHGSGGISVTRKGSKRPNFSHHPRGRASRGKRN